MSKKVFKIKGLDCDSCAKMVELDLEDAGFAASCNFAKETLEVDVASAEEEKKVKTIVTGGGYKLAD